MNPQMLRAAFGVASAVGAAGAISFGSAFARQFGEWTFQKADDFINYVRAGREAKRQSAKCMIEYRVTDFVPSNEEFAASLQPGDIVEFLRVYHFIDFPEFFQAIWFGEREHAFPTQRPFEDWRSGRCFSYIHAAICVGRDSDGHPLLAHFSDAVSPASIIRERFCDASKGSWCRVFNAFDKVFCPLAEERIIERALAATVNTHLHRYNLIQYNCQHFVHFCRYDVVRSPEIELFTSFFANVALVCFVFGAFEYGTDMMVFRLLTRLVDQWQRFQAIWLYRSSPTIQDYVEQGLLDFTEQSGQDNEGRQVVESSAGAPILNSGALNAFASNLIPLRVDDPSAAQNLRQELQNLRRQLEIGIKELMEMTVRAMLLPSESSSANEADANARLDALSNQLVDMSSQMDREAFRRSVPIQLRPLVSALALSRLQEPLRQWVELDIETAVASDYWQTTQRMLSDNNHPQATMHLEEIINVGERADGNSDVTISSDVTEQQGDGHNSTN